MQIDLQVRQVQELVVGIDLGTTNSLVAHVEGGVARVVADRLGRRIVPSVVALDEHHHAVVGDDARDRALSNAEGTIFSVKRLMGRGIADVGDTSRWPYEVVESPASRQAAVRIHGKLYEPQEISAFILHECKKRAEASTGRKIKRAVVTVPAYFDDAQRQATRDAARMAGIDVLRILNEPTAAALAYGLDRKQVGTVLVYDLGGGTFDVSLLRLTEGVFKVIATAGNTQLGGDDFDHAIVDHLLATLPEDVRARARASARILRALKMGAEAAKIQLSDNAEARIGLRFEQEDLQIDQLLDRRTYEGLIAPLVARTLESVRFVLDEASLDPEDIDEVVCVGGSTRTPLVRERIAASFGKAPHTELDPDEVVALGAAIQAHQLAGEHEGDNAVLLDVTPLSLGIETYGGGVQKLLWRNTPIPARATEGFTTYVDDQRAIDIHILQGEREMARDLRSLGRFRLGGIPAMPAGMPRVLVEFFIDADGILKVSAKEMTSGQSAGIEVRPTYGLSDEQVEDMILASIENAETDVEERMLADLKTDAGAVLRYAEKALQEQRTRIDPALTGQVEAAILGLTAARDGDDREALQAALEVMNEVSRPLAAAMMDEVLRVTVTGKTLDEVTGNAGPRTSAASVRLHEGSR